MSGSLAPREFELAEGVPYPATNPQSPIVPTSGEEFCSLLREAEEAEERWANRQL